RSQRAMTADEPDAEPALVALLTQDEDHADLGRGSRVRPAAGLAVETLRVHEAHRVAGLRRRLDALAEGLGAGDDLDAHGPGFPHDLVGADLGRADGLGRQLAVEVHRAGLLAEVEADGPRAVEVQERPRQEVLAVVLLAVVAAPRLVHPSAHA